MKLLAASILSLATFFSFAQTPRPFNIPLGAVADMNSDAPDYYPLLQRLEAPTPGGESEKAKRAALKEELSLKYPKTYGVSGEQFTAPSPWIGANWKANLTSSGVPNDNDLAISNAGLIASVINSHIATYDDTSGARSNKSLSAFSSALGVSGTKFDPRVSYDPHADRFVVCFLSGFASTNSHIILGFSQTNDPMGDWNLYALPGNPDQDSSWTDYPTIALTQGELFITGNLLYDGLSWQLGFKKSICWQINLASGYNGDTLVSNLWDTFDHGGKSTRNLSPAQEGSFPGGPDMYMVSNRNFDAVNDTFFLARISDSIGGSPVLTVDAVIADNTYHMPPEANQIAGLLSTNDARVLDVFMENDKLQFVGNTMDTLTGLASFYHGIMSNVSTNPSINLKTITNDSLEYGYPAIIWAGMSLGSDESMIAINYSSDVHYPGNGAIYFDGVNDYSNLAVIKTGLDIIDVLSGPDRWGDYTGMQRRYNDFGRVWMDASYGKNNKFPGNWIANVNNPSISVGIEDEQLKNHIVASPNPIGESLEIHFEIPTHQWLTIDLFDIQGRKVTNLLEDLVRPGVSRFTIQTNDLSAGTYILRVSTLEGGVIASEKLIKP